MTPTYHTDTDTDADTCVSHTDRRRQEHARSFASTLYLFFLPFFFLTLSLHLSSPLLFPRSSHGLACGTFEFFQWETNKTNGAVNEQCNRTKEVTTTRKYLGGCTCGCRCRCRRRCQFLLTIGMGTCMCSLPWSEHPQLYTCGYPSNQHMHIHIGSVTHICTRHKFMHTRTFTYVHEHTCTSLYMYFSNENMYWFTSTYKRVINTHVLLSQRPSDACLSVYSSLRGIIVNIQRKSNIVLVDANFVGTVR